MRSKNEMDILENMIEQKLDDKAKVLSDDTQSDENFFSALMDVCTLNILRDAKNNSPLSDGKE